MAYIKAGAEDTWAVSSVNGLLVASFSTEELAREWLQRKAGNGVSYRLYKVATDTKEITTG